MKKLDDEYTKYFEKKFKKKLNIIKQLKYATAQ